MSDGGEVWTWGDNAEQQLGRDRGPLPHRVAVPPCALLSCGHSHSVAITADGVFAWGSEAERDADNVTAHRAADMWFATREEPRKWAWRSAQPAVAVSCGMAYTLLATSSGAVFANGYGPNGELGLGPDIECVFEPRPVPLPRTDGSTTMELEDPVKPIRDQT